MAKAGRGDDQYMVRFPEGLRDKIKTAAEANSRSMNTEIVERLESSFQDPLVLPPDILTRLERRARENHVPVRSLVLTAIDKQFPAGYGVGEFIENWALRAVRSSSRAERARIIDEANDDFESRVSGLSLREQSYEHSSEILVYLFADKVVEIIASLPARRLEE